MSTPLVSVIVPNYNHAKYLPRRLESILAQTAVDFELILLDDCSTDDSRSLLTRFAATDARCRCVFNAKNSGSVFRQWNLGVGMARGKYIWIAESDDWAAPTFLAQLVSALERNPRCGIAYCQSRTIDELD